MTRDQEIDRRLGRLRSATETLEPPAYLSTRVRAAVAERRATAAGASVWIWVGAMARLAMPAAALAVVLAGIMAWRSDVALQRARLAQAVAMVEVAP